MIIITILLLLRSIILKWLRSRLPSCQTSIASCHHLFFCLKINWGHRLRHWFREDARALLADHISRRGWQVAEYSYVGDLAHDLVSIDKDPFITLSIAFLQVDSIFHFIEFIVFVFFTLTSYSGFKTFAAVNILLRSTNLTIVFITILIFRLQVLLVYRSITCIVCNFMRLSLVMMLSLTRCLSVIITLFIVLVSVLIF